MKLKLLMGILCALFSIDYIHAMENDENVTVLPVQQLIASLTLSKFEHFMYKGKLITRFAGKSFTSQQFIQEIDDVINEYCNSLAKENTNTYWVKEDLQKHRINLYFAMLKQRDFELSYDPITKQYKRVIVFHDFGKVLDAIAQTTSPELESLRRQATHYGYVADQKSESDLVIPTPWSEVFWKKNGKETKDGVIKITHSLDELAELYRKGKGVVPRSKL